MNVNVGKQWIQGIFLLLGVGAGAVGTYLYTVRVEESKLFLQERIDGCSELFYGTVALKLAESKDYLAKAAKSKGNESKAKQIEDDVEKQRELSDTHYLKARFKIGVFGDADVVQACARYWSKYPTIPPLCGDRDIWLADAAIYQSMRRAMGARGEVENEDLVLVLFGCILKE